MASNGDSLDKLNTEVKKEITSLLISSSKGITVKQLQHDYCDFIGRQIPYNVLGFSTLESYLKSIPDVLRVSGYGIHAMVEPVVTEKTKHINEMILKQRPPKTNTRYRPLRRSRGIYAVRSEPSSGPRLQPRPQPRPTRYETEVEPFKLPSKPANHLPPPHDYQMDMRKQNPNQTFNFYKPYYKPPENNVNSCDNRLTCDDLKKPSPSPPSVEPKTDYSRSYRSLDTVDSYSDDEDSDAEFFEEELDLGDFTFQSDNEAELATSVKNVSLEPETTIQDLVEAHMREDSFKNDPHIPRVSKKVIEKLKILIGEHPEGIWCSKLVRKYEERFGQKLDPMNFNFPSVIQMCDDLPEIFTCIRPNRTDWKIYDKSKPLPDIFTVQDFSKYLESIPLVPENKSNTEPALPTNVSYSTPSYDYPEDVFFPGEVLPRQWLENHEKSGDYIELIVTEIFDPSKFWIQLSGPTTSQALSKLMDNMQLFYVSNWQNYQLNDESVQVGLLVSALFMKEYHRAIILKIFDDSTIKVFYCDYGTVAQVHLRNTCFLRREFGELPMQAIRARLANIIPIEQNTMWPRAASLMMLQLIKEKDLIGYINCIDYKESVLDLIVSDTTVPDVDVHVNDELVERGFALLGTEAPLCTTSSAIVPNVHLYPAFTELENAVYPCISDVITMMKIGHTYETIFHGYFAPSNIYNTHDFSHSRCEVDQSFTGEAETLQEYQEETNEHEQFLKNEQEEESSSESHITVSPVTSEVNIQTEETQPDEEESEYFSTSRSELNYGESARTEMNYAESTRTETNYAESTRTEGSFCRKPPPGFENVQPRNTPEIEFINMLKEAANIPQRQPTNPLNPLQGIPLLQNPYQNYPLMNTNFNSSCNYLLSNPMVYNHLMLNQQREAILQTVQQVQLAEWQKLQELKRQQQLMQISQVVNSVPPGFVPTTPNAYYGPQPDKYQPVTNMANFNNDLPSCSLTTHIPPSESLNSSFQISDVHRDSTDIISSKSEHICYRFVLKLKMGDYILHVLNIEGTFFVLTQEIITNLLKSDLPWKQWLIFKNLNSNSVPNKLVNILDYDHVYNQMKRFHIPGVNPPNCFGCIVRLTPLSYVADIVEKYGNKNLLFDLKTEITHVIENPDVWKMLDPLTD